MTVAQRNTLTHAAFLTNRPETTPQGRLLRGYLHKTSNSLCGIKGYASLIAEEDYLDNPAVKWALKIIREVEKMEDIFRSVGDLTGSTAETYGQQTLSNVLDEVIKQALCEHDNLRIRCGSIPEGCLLLPAADLFLVLKEVLKNSAESVSAKKDTVTVEIDFTLSCEGRISLRLQDDGPGIPAEMSDQVIDPFLTTKNGHLGIGLTRVDTLLDMYGLAWILTSTEQQGTAVTLGAAKAMDAPV